MNYVRLMICILSIVGCQPTTTTVTPKTKQPDTSEDKTQRPLSKSVVNSLDINKTLRNYETALDKSIQVLSRDNDIKTVDAQAMELFKLGRLLTRYVSTTQTECNEYLSRLLSVDEALLELSPEVIEAGYHRDGRLPKSPSPKCYHAKDLMVHPATVFVLNKVTPRPKSELMLREVVELKGHLDEIKNLVEGQNH
jgi:hypothetical protein